MPRRSAKVLRLPVPEAVRRGRRRRLIALGVLAIILAGIAANERLTALSSSNVLKPSLRANAIERRLFRLANNARVRAGLPALAFSRPLMAAAYFHSADMALAGYRGFDGPGGDTPVDRIKGAGLDYREAAETYYSDTASGLHDFADHAIAQWLAAPATRKTLLSPDFTATAIAVARAADGSIYLTEDFIR
ncbi:MAG: CAP domain-containing protein [Candidatus Binataceae bacterium]|jgi:uncharacterized protein YkwD